jgi:hypothetical protein
MVDKSVQGGKLVHGGDHAWFYGNDDGSVYPDNSDDYVQSPDITRAASGWGKLTFWANYDTEKGFDGLNVLASDDPVGATYTQVPLIDAGPAEPPGLSSAEIDGNSGGYRLLTFDLSGFTGSTIRFRLEFTSDAGVGKTGFAFDDLTVLGTVDASVGSTMTGASASDSSISSSTGRVRPPTPMCRRPTSASPEAERCGPSSRAASLASTECISTARPVARRRSGSRSRLARKRLPDAPSA